MKERFFPEDYRAFVSGVLSCCMDRFGGIESLHLLDTVVCNGKPQVAMRALQLFSRSGTSENRPLLYPALRAMREYPDGSVRPFTPEYPDIFPSAVIGSEYEFVMTPRSFSMLLKDPQKSGEREFVLAVTKAHYMTQTRLENANYNQLAHEHVWLPPELRGPDFDEDKPFKDAPIDITRSEPECYRDSVVFRLRLVTVEYDKEIVMAFSSDLPLRLDVQHNQWCLRTGMRAENVARIGFGWGGDADSAVAAAHEAVSKHKKRIGEHTAPNRFEAAVKVDIPTLPAAADFMKTAPYYQDALVMDNGESGVGIRAAANKFGFFPIWDHIYPLRDFLHAGRPETARRALRYMLDYPHWDTNPFVMMHLSMALDEYLAFQPQDTQLLNDFMPAFRKAFNFTETLLNPETGLIRYGIDTAVDVMQELGLPRLFNASCVNGWWHGSCCAIANFALECGDRELAERAISWQRRIEAHYADIFFDKDVGAIRAAVGPSGERMKHEIYLHTKSLSDDYVQGMWLLRRIRRQQADYLMRRLWHPLGVTAVAYDSEAPAIYLKGTRMNQHLGHCCKLLRQAGRMDGALHLLDGYLYAFTKYRNAIETFNYSYCAGNQTQTAEWQAFSATAAMQAIVLGAVGIAWHRGGIFYVPTTGAVPCRLENLHFAGRIYDLEVSGAGDCVEEFSVNGKPLVGTMQLPADILPPVGERVVLKVRLGCRKTSSKLLWAIDLPITDFASDDSSVCFTASASRYTFIEFQAASKPQLAIDGVEALLEWDADSGRAWWSGLAEKGVRFVFTLK